MLRQRHKKNFENYKSISIFDKIDGYTKCLLAGYKVSRLTVSGLLSILDPEGVELRKRKRLRRRKYYAKGPNYLWHVDSYDKF